MVEKTIDDKEEDESGGLMWLGIGLGILVGGILVAMFIKSRSNTTTPATLTQNAQFPNTPPIIIYPTFNLSIPMPGNEQYNAMDTIYPAEVTGTNTMQPEQSAASFGIYKNKEEWEIERGEDGLIKNISVHRDVKLDATE